MADDHQARANVGVDRAIGRKTGISVLYPAISFHALHALLHIFTTLQKSLSVASIAVLVFCYRVTLCRRGYSATATTAAARQQQEEPAAAEVLSPGRCIIARLQRAPPGRPGGAAADDFSHHCSGERSGRDRRRLHARLGRCSASQAVCPDTPRTESESKPGSEREKQSPPRVRSSGPRITAELEPSRSLAGAALRRVNRGSGYLRLADYHEALHGI